MSINLIFNSTLKQVWMGMLFSSILVFVSCSEKKQFVQKPDLIPNIDTSVHYSFEKTYLRISNDTNDPILSYFTFSDVLDSQKITSLTENYYINIVDIGDRSVKKIKIPSLLKAKIKRSKPVVQYCHYNDSIYYFLLRDTLAKWNSKNSEIYFQKLILPKDYDSDKYYLSINLVQEFGFPMYHKEDILHFGSFLINKKTRIWTLNSNNYPYQVNFPLNNSRSFTSKFNFPEYVIENYYGLRFGTYRLNINNGNVISFPFSGNLYISSRENDSISIIGGKSKYQIDNYIKPLSSKYEKNLISSDSEWSYYNHTEYYSQIIYNSNTQIYFRLFYHSMPLNKNDGFYNTHRDRIISVQVFDKNFTLKHEAILKGIWFVMYFLPYKNGFVINNNGIDPKKDNYEFLYFNVITK